MEIVGMKKKYSFTLPPDLVDWLREYAEKNYTTMSAVITSQLYKLNSQVESTIKGRGVDLTKRLPSEITST
jgi:hypothetical protein